MQTTIEYEPIIRKLLEKSEQGRLNWVEARRREETHGMILGPVEPPIYFTCTVEGQYTFDSERTDEGYKLTIKDSGGVEFFSITGEQAVVYDDPKKEELFNMLRDLYELARNKALNVDEKLATATVLLDKI